MSFHKVIKVLRKRH